MLLRRWIYFVFGYAKWSKVVLQSVTQTPHNDSHELTLAAATVASLCWAAIATQRNSADHLSCAGDAWTGVCQSLCFLLIALCLSVYCTLSTVVVNEHHYNSEVFYARNVNSGLRVGLCPRQVLEEEDYAVHNFFIWTHHHYAYNMLSWYA